MQFLKYSSVGVVATLSHYLLLFFCVELAHFPAPVSSGAGALTGALVGYYGNHRFTFRSLHHHHHPLPKFLVIATAGALLNIGIVWIGTFLFQFHYFLAQVIATGSVLLLTYRINQSWTFAS